MLVKEKLPVGQSERLTQALLCSSIMVSLGHWQPLMTQTVGHIKTSFMLAHVVLHGEAHPTRT